MDVSQVHDLERWFLPFENSSIAYAWKKIRWSYCQTLNEPIIDEVLFFCASVLQIKWIAMLSFILFSSVVLVSGQSVTLRLSTKGKQSAFWCPTGGLLISSSLTASLIERSIVVRRSHSLKRYTFKVKVPELYSSPGENGPGSWL